MVWFAPKHAHSTLVEAQEWERKKKKTKKTKCSTESVEGICYAVLHLRIYWNYVRKVILNFLPRSCKNTMWRDWEREREPMANAYGKRAHINQSTEPSNNHKCERAIRCLFNMNLLVSVSAFFGCCCYFFWLFFFLSNVVALWKSTRDTCLEARDAIPSQVNWNRILEHVKCTECNIWECISRHERKLNNLFTVSSDRNKLIGIRWGKWSANWCYTMFSTFWFNALCNEAHRW